MCWSWWICVMRSDSTVSRNLSRPYWLPTSDVYKRQGSGSSPMYVLFFRKNLPLLWRRASREWIKRSMDLPGRTQYFPAWRAGRLPLSGYGVMNSSKAVSPVSTHAERARDMPAGSHPPQWTEWKQQKRWSENLHLSDHKMNFSHTCSQNFGWVKK